MVRNSCGVRTVGRFNGKYRYLSLDRLPAAAGLLLMVSFVVSAGQGWCGPPRCAPPVLELRSACQELRGGVLVVGLGVWYAVEKHGKKEEEGLIDDGLTD